MRGEQYRPLLVAGVAGGVGTSTWTRCLRIATNLDIEDLGVYGGGPVDVLVSSNTAASASRLGPVIAACPRPPVLIVMHTAAGVVAGSRPHLRKVSPHLSARFDISHRRQWLEMEAAPGKRLPAKAKDIVEALQRFPHALRAMYMEPPPRLRVQPFPVEHRSLAQPHMNADGLDVTAPYQRHWPAPGSGPPSMRRGH